MSIIIKKLTKFDKKYTNNIILSKKITIKFRHIKIEKICKNKKM